MPNPRESAIPVLYSTRACPYAQRTRALLSLKAVPFREVEIDITRPRPEWYLAMQPSGKVPAIHHDGCVVSESSVINEYLEEVFPEPPAMPSSPTERAKARMFIEFCNNRFAPNMYRALMEQNGARRARAQDLAGKDWARLDRMLEDVRSDGDTALGNFGIVELTFGPFFQRYALTDYYWGFRPWDDPRIQLAKRWSASTAAHPALFTTGMTAIEYIKLYEDYAYGYANGQLRHGQSCSSLDLSVPLSERPMPRRRVTDGPDSAF